MPKSKVHIVQASKNNKMVDVQKQESEVKGDNK